MDAPEGDARDTHTHHTIGSQAPHTPDHTLGIMELRTRREYKRADGTLRNAVPAVGERDFRAPDTRCDSQTANIVIDAPDESLLLDASHGPSHLPRARRAQMSMPMRARALEFDVKA